MFKSISSSLTVYFYPFFSLFFFHCFFFTHFSLFPLIFFLFFSLFCHLFSVRHLSCVRRQGLPGKARKARPVRPWRSHRGMLVLIHCVILNDAPNDVYLFITSFTVFIYSFVVTYASSHTNSRIRILMENSLIRRPLRSGISP